ncbi:protein of unknown function [[Clostridium] ultunense Esp]|uniref:Uncharacterized protein n=1 Tax=[Clostridium] ultunense Esp TaxID=1288971 RepID=A0A1M4PP73_9FIRM|nr:protein of unknown function [[Clostridium] ultunense Esp]
MLSNILICSFLSSSIILNSSISLFTIFISFLVACIELNVTGARLGMLCLNWIAIKMPKRTEKAKITKLYLFILFIFLFI